MTSRGTIRIARQLLSHPLWAEKEFCEGFAWTWLLSEAAWAPREVIAAGATIAVERSELVASSRYLAKAWKWSEPRVRRYLQSLETHGMIRRRVHTSSATDSGITVITIIDFDVHQGIDTRRSSNDHANASVDRARAAAPADMAEKKIATVRTAPVLGCDESTREASRRFRHATETPRNAGCDAPSSFNNADQSSTSSDGKRATDALPDAGSDAKRARDMRAMTGKVIALFSEMSPPVSSAVHWPKDAFDRWYAVYPRKKDPLAARRAFDKARARADVTFDELMKTTHAYAHDVAQWPRDRQQFVPYPATWLNKGGYLSEPDIPDRPPMSTDTARDPRTFSDDEWAIRIRNHMQHGRWFASWGPPPGASGCLVPLRLQGVNAC